ncbi:MAG: colanic acid biosynthesis glycosyltransferase WcaL, partial [Chthoniobacterales bacterium]
MDKPIVASYTTFFLKKEMRHIYRQITGLREFRTFVITKDRMNEAEYPFPDIEVLTEKRGRLLERFKLKYIQRQPSFFYRGEDVPLNAALDRWNCPLMHIYFGHTGVYLMPFLKQWQGKALVSFHGMDVMPRENERGYTKKLRELLQVIPLVLARSQSLVKKLEALGCPPEKIRINRTGIPLDEFPVAERNFPKDGKWRIVQACRLIEKKGLPTALCAFARFHAK